MANFQGKSVWRRILLSPLFLVFFAFVLVAFTLNMIGFISKLELAIHKKDIALEKVDALKASQERLQADIAGLNTEKGVEETIREKYGLGKAGEGLVVIVDEERKDAPSPKKGVFQSIFYFFENMFE